MDISHTIRLCKVDEINKLQDFIHNEWRKEHILSKSKYLLDFQHLDKQSGNYNFIVAENDISKEFDAVLGFIPTNQYDRSIISRDIWLAIWKAKSNFPTLGLRIFLALEEIYKPTSIAASGISNEGLKFYQALHYKIGTMNHFYIKNDLLKVFNIADFKQYKAPYEKSLLTIKSITRKEFESSGLEFNFYPHKTLVYFINRYLGHSLYDYKIYGIFANNKILAAFVVRVQDCQHTQCLRIIDWIGEFPINIYSCFQELLQEKECEYIDMLCYMEDITPILDMGFRLKEKDEIVPNYFEPFEKKNVLVNVAYKANYQNYTFFKGDSDQDRPSVISN